MFTKETGVFITLITGLLILTILLLFFIVSIIRQQKRSIKDYKLHALRDMALIEEERKRIAADLHDDFGSILAAIRLRSETMHENDPNNSLLKDTIKHLDLSLIRLKQIAHNLMPGILQSRGLGAAINELLLEIKTASNMKISFINTCNEQDFLPQKSIILFRVIQEIITNIVKHSKATTIDLLYSTSKRHLILTISDNGIGFIPIHSQKSGKNFGLQNIYSRLELLDATYSLETYPEKGVTYKIDIPLSSMKYHYEVASTH